MFTLQIVEPGLEDLKPYENTSRTHNRALLRRFDPLGPVVVDPNDVIADGHPCRTNVLSCSATKPSPRCSRVIYPGANPIRVKLRRLPRDSGWAKEQLRNSPSTSVIEEPDALIAPFALVISAPAISSIVALTGWLCWGARQETR
jgi:hypothetical protein